MTPPRILVERQGTTLFVGINRPEKRNALDEATIDELTEVLHRANRSPCIVVVHSTTPGMFVSGADIGELLKRDSDDALRSINAALFERLEMHRWPTIAAIDGDTFGGGCELAMATDIRVSSTRSHFRQPELALGVIAGGGANWRLPQLVGIARARRMLYLGEPLGADEAQLAGLVDFVCPAGRVLDTARELADQIASKSWQALELTKLALRHHRPASTSFDITAQAVLFESDDKRQRLKAFLDRPKRGQDHGLAARGEQD